MAKVKYFDGIKSAQDAQLSAPFGSLEPFDFASLAQKSGLKRLLAKVSQGLLNPIYAFSRAFMPVMPLAGLVHITRDEQVRDILSRPTEFLTPFGPEMAELGSGATFLLGLDGPEHDRLHSIVAKIIHRGDSEKVAEMSTQFANALLENSVGKIDVVGDLIKRVPSEICLRYFGLKCDDVDAFGDWTMAISALLFGDPYGNPKIRKLAMNANKRLGFIIEDALIRTRQLFARGKTPSDGGQTLVERLLILQQNEPLSDGEIHAIILGLATGFIPTNTLAGTRMLQVLLDRPDAMALARTAAANNDRQAMIKIVYEAGRLNPALAPGQWRYCPRDTHLIVDQRPRLIKAGTTLLVSTMSAMRDKRAVVEPNRFWPDRTGPNGQWQEPELVFGIGAHTCMGKHLALAQISSLFIALLKQPDLKPAKGEAGKMQSIGPFPRALDMTFATPSATQTMFIILARTVKGTSKLELDDMIAALGNPSSEAVRKVIDGTNIIHFTSIATIPHDDGLDVSWELTVDGTEANAIAILSSQCAGLFRPIFAHCGLKDGEDFAAFLARHVVKLHGKPWGGNGLNFNGMGEFPIVTVDKQAQFAGFVGRVLDEFLATEAARGSHAMSAVTHVRRMLSQDRILALSATPSRRALMEEAKSKGFDADQLKPSSVKLKIADYKKRSVLASFFAFLGSRDALIVVVPILALLTVYGLLFWSLDPSVGVIWGYIGTGLRALLATIVTFSLLIFAFFKAIRRAEKKDPIDTSQASLDHMASIAKTEDAPGYTQNHILAVGDMKPGFLRAFAHAFALWAIRVMITHGFRPGFVINMGTIHYARWWRIPGTNKTAFYSNFNGSWESYLEDFITRARWGQTAVWSNWTGFPSTKYLIFSGAEQGDNFKRWVRTRQQVVPFWYSRFPKLTTDQIRNNALIHTGVARVSSNSEAEEWLRCFGSMPRVDNLIESDEVQAIVFSGMKRLPVSATLALKLPKAPLLGEWLSWISGQMQVLDDVNAPANAPALKDLISSGVIVPTHGRDGGLEGYSLAHSLTLTFGDRPLVGDASIYETTPDSIDVSAPEGHAERLGQADARQAARRAVVLGLSALGVSQFTAPNALKGSLLEAFSPAFRLGMAERGRLLGDVDASDAKHWRWSDGNVDAVLTIYAETKEDLNKVVEIHRALLENYGGEHIHQLICQPPNPTKPEFEHFGYRDGISQPTIKGTSRASRIVPARDLIEPGEFILGYKNGGGHFPPSPLLAAEADLARILPLLCDGNFSRYPDFGNSSLDVVPRDLGRNGTYLVMRELAQDVDGFEAFVARKAAEIRGNLVGEGQTVYRDLYKLIGQHPDGDWVKAKLMGRWPNGRPLIGNPVNTRSPQPGDKDEAICRAAETENDFTYGRDDAQGLACPFASHIRRSNPRDSQQPGDVKEQIITNRHRLLRRGRTYTKELINGEAEKGLLFVSLCTDIERQFEFVQQVWSNSSSFHGLTNEPDPIFGSDTPDTDTGGICPREFTIPTPAGPIKLTGMENFVSVKAGGYFFLPSRSALKWLTDVALNTQS